VQLKDIEGQASILQLLQVLLQKDGQSIREVMERVTSSPSTLLKGVDHLIGMKLVAENRMQKFPFRRELYLTEKGRKIAEKVEEMSEILKLD
jgi:DNA-binding MarR family transcriptional regulator